MSRAAGNTKENFDKENVHCVMSLLYLLKIGCFFYFQGTKILMFVFNTVSLLINDEPDKYKS